MIIGTANHVQSILERNRIQDMNIKTFDLNLLRVFAAVYAERNVSKAAVAAGLSQPAMSERVRKLEAAGVIEGYGARVMLSHHGDRPREEVAAALARASTSAIEAQAVAHAAYRMQQRPVRYVVQLAAQAADMHVDHIGAGVEMIVPHALQQHGAGDDLVGVLGWCRGRRRGGAHREHRCSSDEQGLHRIRLRQARTTRSIPSRTECAPSRVTT